MEVKKKDNKEKYYVVRPIKESHYDDEFRIVGTKKDIADYISEQVEDTFPWSYELDKKFLVDKHKPLFYIDFHAGSSDGKSGFGASKIFDSEKKAKDWMIEYISESDIGVPPKSFIFHVEPVYWITRRKGK
ncbi:MAG: hypothetical protein IMZ52_01125 [Actinobacteria bacterium]|nr:hypothetical protein [Actinomycetota bacterium]MBE3114740.1 hypothetical protein [Actinomycetota bacterium]